jgi:hypothetical protein
MAAPSVIHGPNAVSRPSEKTATMTQIHIRERTSDQPSRSSARIVVRTPGSPRGRGLSRTRKAAETRNVAASSANA